MNWKPVYAILIFTSTLVTWLCGILLEKSETRQKKRMFLTISLLINFGILFVFKYFNFINDSVFQLLGFAGLRWPVPNLDLLLPVGISFYTFQAVGYTIDVYRGDLKAEKNLGIYALFVSFFPQLVAGPIERAKNLLPQLRRRHSFDYIRLEAGLKQMIWGYFMKVVIADRLGLLVSTTFNNVDHHNGTTFLISSIFFTFQVYCDFSGYSNIAIGAARIMGFDLMTNFKRPLLAWNMFDLWRRWHISLSTWFRDYIYFPLGGNRKGVWRNYINIFITFLVSGIWHGANWTYVIFGGLHGIYLVVQRILRVDKIDVDQSKLLKFVMIILNFFLFSISLVIFRANSISDALKIFSKILTDHGIPFRDTITVYFYGLFGILILMIKELVEEYYLDRFNFIENKNPVVSAFAVSLVVILIISIGVFDGGQFIYFQF